MKASKSLLIFLFGTSIINVSSAQTLINPDGISTSGSLPANSLSASIGASNSTSVGNWGNGTAGGNLMVGTSNGAMNSDSVISAGLFNNVRNQEGSFVFGFFNEMAFPTSSSWGQSNIIMGYNNIVGSGNDDQTWGAIILGDTNETDANDSWVIGRGNIGQSDTLTVGTFAQTEANAAFIVGRGLHPSQRSNGLVVFRDGNTAFGGDLKVPSNKGIYFGTSTLPTLSVGAGGSAVFPYGVSAPNGLQVSGGNLVISSNTASSSSSTGALSVAGGIGIGMDSWINGVRIGRGSGNVASNTSIGAGALNANLTASSNTAIGNLALNSNTSGNSNTALGSEALKANTTAGGNTAIGVRALKSNVNGGLNTGIGLNTLQANISGSQNVATGLSSLYSNTTGSFNVTLGNTSLYFNTTGSNNIAIGNQAGRLTANNSNLTDPESSIYIGNNTRGLDNFDNNSIVIGANAIGQGANTTVIGNSNTTNTRIFGNLVVGSGTGSPVLTQSAADSSYLPANPTSIRGNSTVLSNGGLIALGITSQATSQGSIALGDYTFATNNYTVALQGGEAGGMNSFASNWGQAWGDMSVAFMSAYALGISSVAISGIDPVTGDANWASGNGSTAIGGSSNQAIGDYSYALGWNSFALGKHSYSIGYLTRTNGYAVSLGSQNLSSGNLLPNMENDSWVENGALFELGNGRPNDQGGNWDYSNAITTLKNGQTTLTNKAWKANPSTPLADPTPTTDSGGNALVVEGHTVLKGKVIIEQAQGDISMGIYQ